jgi:predicted nucleic acid-binding protein
LIVLDASIAASWFFSDESDELTRTSAELVLSETALVPSIFPAELANALLFAHRKGRIPKDGLKGALERIQQLPIRIESPGFDLRTEIGLATRYGLTIYDAMYLGLAERYRVALLTRDSALRAAALDAGLSEETD